MISEYADLLAKAATRIAENRKFFKKLARWNGRQLDETFHEAHEAVFSRINCLECANCCTTLGPRLIPADIERIASGLKMKPSLFQETYLVLDEDGDFVFRTMPCPFLKSDNCCQIYDVRPRACRDYPHTDRRKIYQVLDLTLKNSLTCPAVYEMIERMKKNERE
jgi:Fe-S-cluster containining protein